MRGVLGGVPRDSVNSALLINSVIWKWKPQQVNQPRKQDKPLTVYQLNYKTKFAKASIFSL